MARLPPHHVPRPRLTAMCATESVVVIEAAGGYGKTTLASELVDQLRAIAVEVVLEDGPVPAEVLASRLHAAVRRAGFSVAAAAMDAFSEDPVGAVDAALDMLQGEDCVLVIDDAHHASRGAAGLITRLAEHLTGKVRLLVLARQLPAGAERLRRAGALCLGAADLVMSTAEVRGVCNQGFGLTIDAEEAAALARATGGWTAAAVLAAARARRTGEQVYDLAWAAGRVDRNAGTVAVILDEALVNLEPYRQVVAQLGRLPMFSPEVVDAMAAAPGFFDRALAAGLPLVPTDDGWWSVPGTARDLLMSLAPADADALGRAAVALQQRGRTDMALDLLMSSDQPLQAVLLLAAVPPAQLELVDVHELLAVIDRLPEDALAAHPMVLLELARCCDAAAQIDRKRQLLRLAADIADRSDDQGIRRRIAVETAIDQVRDGEYEKAEQAANEVLRHATSEEVLTQARAFAVLGRAQCQHVGASGRREPSSFRRGDEYLGRAADLYRRLGMRSALAGITAYQGWLIHFARGDCATALRYMDETLALAVDHPRRWAYNLNFRAEIALELGRHDDALEDVGEVFKVAERLGDEQIRAYGHWVLAVSASYRGDTLETLAQVRQVEAHKGDWWDLGPGDFLADAADFLDRVGYEGMALEYLQQAKEDPREAGPRIAVAEAALLARHGDPELAEARLLAAPGHGTAPREQWRLTLLRAYASLRRGDRSAGALAARAFEEAARLGLPEVPLVRERALTGELMALAAETGQPAAVALSSVSLPTQLALLGRFELTRGGRPVPLAAGHASQLLKLVAVNHGRLHSEQAMEALWPEADLDAGRNRLRTVISRLRSAAGPVLGRDGDHLVLAPEVRVDLALFREEARRALAIGLADPTLAVAAGRSAIARYRGDLLPDDVYEPWAEVARDQARQTVLELLDLCAAAASGKGDLDELRLVVERTIQLAPYDADRYLRTASVFLEQGRRGAALSVVRRAKRALDELAVPLPPQLVALESSIVA